MAARKPRKAAAKKLKKVVGKVAKRRATARRRPGRSY